VAWCGVAGNGLIDFAEFSEMMSGRLSTLPPPSPPSSSVDLQLTSGDLRSLFMAFDKDQSGYIDADELRQTMSAVGLQLTDSDVAVMMKAAGVPSRAGRIYYEGKYIYSELSKINAALQRSHLRRSQFALYCAAAAAVVAITPLLNMPKPYPTDTLATTYCSKLQS